MTGTGSRACVGGTFGTCSCDVPDTDLGVGCACEAGDSETRPTPACGEESRACDGCDWGPWEQVSPDEVDPECRLGEARYDADDPTLRRDCDGTRRRFPCVDCRWSTEPSECGGGCPGERRPGPEEKEELCVPAGVFTRGCEDAALGCAPRHDVFLSPYYIDRFSVTVRRYQECVDDGACTALEPMTFPYEGDDVTVDDLALDDEVIVWTATYDQAESFCEWDGAAVASGAQWERAALGLFESARLPWQEGRESEPSLLDYCFGVPFNGACMLAVDFPPREALPYYYLEGRLHSTGMMNLWWYLEWTRDTLEPYDVGTEVPVDPVISGSSRHELRGGVGQASRFTYGLDIALRDATQGATSWGIDSRGAIRCARPAQGSRR